ncbi:MAG: hypothetical protein M1818_003028 [Claussenomyces sp. TS43310]|nr:MAG: hypothetical protein M1818_003028 [Claussenomyces sp. TS43310]
MMEDDESETGTTWVRNVVSIFLVCLAGTAGWVIAWQAGVWTPTPEGTNEPAARQQVAIGAEILGYLSALCYLGARIPQIVKNHRDKSCEGLALLFFLLSLMGNATYGAGILFHSLEKDYLLTNLPWLIGSLGTMVEDGIIFMQFPIIQGLSPSASSAGPAAAIAQDGILSEDFAANHEASEASYSPTLSRTSTLDGGSSPVLPPLHPPAINGRTFDLYGTPPSDPGTSSSRYFTASWGSPYQEFASLPSSSQGPNHQKTLSEASSEESPLRRLALHTPFLRPPPAFGRSQTDSALPTRGAVSATVLANRARRPTRGLTEDWIRQHTAGSLETESLNWLSDSNGESGHSSLSSSDFDRDAEEDDFDPKTPTLKTFVEQRATAREKNRRKRHFRQPSAETITQADFHNASRNLQGEMASSVAASVPAELAGLDTAQDGLAPEDDINHTLFDAMNDKPLPARPDDGPLRKHETSDWRAAALPSLHSGSSPRDSAASPAPAAPRLKKKVMWKGKGILISLPMDTERGQPGKAPTPLTDQDVQSMHREWERLGYNTNGFTLGPWDAKSVEDQGQSRNIWPDSRTLQQERQSTHYRVSIPDRRHWDAYVQELREAKLRALGVSLGDEEPAAPAIPMPAALSRQASMQYPALPFSPPIPTSSAASSHATQHPNPFSPLLMGAGANPSTNQSSNVGSIASPASMQAPMYGKFNPRQSVSLSSGDHPFGSPFQYPQQPSPGVWSPQSMLYQPGMARGGSPLLSNLGVVASPSSPFQHDGYFHQNDMAHQILQRQISDQMQGHLRSQFSQNSSNPNDVQDDDDEPQKSPSKTPEAFQTHKLNASESLQKEIDDAEYHLEEQFQRQLEHDDYSPHSEKGEHSAVKAFDAPSQSEARKPPSGGLSGSRYAAKSGAEGPVLHHPQPHIRGHSLSQRPFDRENASSPALGIFGEKSKLDTSDIDTNPSNLGTPDLSSIAGETHYEEFSNPKNPWLDSDNPMADKPAVPKRYSHASKSSISRLNVEAPEFKFDPTTSFKPGQFSFIGSSLQSSAATNQVFAPSAAAQSKKTSIGSPVTAGSKISVTAPSFTPGHSDFSFSSAGPVFRPDAPAFTPLNPELSKSIGSAQSSTPVSSTGRAPIFGKIDMSLADIVKLPKKSKAIPIVRPDSSAGVEKPSERETSVGEDGRITQGVGRIKRARGAERDADSIPLFAQPTIPLQETNREQPPPKETIPAASKQVDKENAAPVDVDKPALTVKAVVQTRARSLLEDSPDYDGKSYAPWEFEHQEHAGEFNAASPSPAREPELSTGKATTNDENQRLTEKTEAPRPEIGFSSPKKSHKKNSLSALAKPFEFGSSWFRYGGDAPGTSSPKRPADVPLSPIPPLALPALSAPMPSAGLSSSRYAVTSPNQPVEIVTSAEKPSIHASLQQQPTPPAQSEEEETAAQSEQDGSHAAAETEGPTFEEIDAVMRHMNQVESEKAASRETDTPRWHQPSPRRTVQIPDADSSPIRLQAQNLLRSDAPSPSPRRFHALPGEIPSHRIFSRPHDDPFIGGSDLGQPLESPIHNLNQGNSQPPSDWDDVLSESENVKFHARTQFFDNHVNDLVGGLIAEKLDPMERVLEAIQQSLATMHAREPSSRRERRSLSADLPESDADDEDDDSQHRRSISPRKDRKMEKIRSIVIEALSSHHQSSAPVDDPSTDPRDLSNVMKALEEMREQFDQSMRLDLRGENMRNIVEEAVGKRLAATTQLVDKSSDAKSVDLEATVSDLRSRLQNSNEKTEKEIKSRRAAEDRLAEVERLLRISSEEEDRLRESTAEKDQKLKSFEDSRSKNNMRTAVLEAMAENSAKGHAELSHRLTSTENELWEARQEAQRWRVEAERMSEVAKRHGAEAERTKESNSSLRTAVERLKLQMEESLHTRENMRRKLDSLQQGMAGAAHDISQENARRAKTEQELIARQEVLDARLQAEGRTRERLEQEIDRLEKGEREGMRAVSESKRLDARFLALRTELDEAQTNAMRYKREFEEARESGLSEVQRTRNYMQLEVESANNQVNIVRQDLEDQISRLRSDLEHSRLDADTAKAKHEMLFEEAMESKQKEIDQLNRRNENEIEDIQTRHDRELSNATEDAARSEQQLLERLSLSTTKTEHLQDRLTHLEERLEIAKSAALAAAQAARSAPPAKHVLQATGLPEKISPQALRESIMVLQEQLQDREQTIEKLEQKLSTVDLDAPAKISKRDDEIVWLRELLAVRVGDLQDIISTISQDSFEPNSVRDAAIRLKANLQMEEQERERAKNGASAMKLPNIAASIKDAASPRVAQVVGPMAAAWGNWRKAQVGNLAEMMSNGSTPVRPTPRSQSFLSGLMTPPATTKTPPQQSQPSAFGNTGRRLTAQQLTNHSSPGRTSARRQEKMPAAEPSTPPMMRQGSYDQDAQAEDFSDAGFYDDDESTIEDNSLAG